MPRLSLWKENKSNDYRFLDRTISEMFTVGATDLYIHKYVGANNPSNSQDLTLPHYPEDTATNIQDLLFLENRDRKYDPNIYRLRGHYNVQNLDFDLSQFGLFLTNDIIFITVHYNDMIDVIGRKLMVGDVFELPHLTDYHPLNETIPIGLRRYYQITDANFASEGFSVTWWPHLWRIKCEPLVDSQEFSDILNQPINKDNYMGDWSNTIAYQPGYTVTYGDKIYVAIAPVPAGVAPPDPAYWQESAADNLRDIIGRYNKNIQINDANLAEAAKLVPKSGYDVSQLYVLPTYDDSIPAPPQNVIIANGDVVTPGMQVQKISNPRYRNSSTVLRIPKNIKDGPSVDRGNVVLLHGLVSAPPLTESGSGPVAGEPYISTTFLVSGPQTGPYGTSDNTYATSDQYINFVLTTSLPIPQGSNTISLQEIPDYLTTGLVVRAVRYSENHTPNPIFIEGTTITAITNNQFKIITISSSTLAAMPAGTGIEVAYNFSGTVTPEMDYLADCDPRFLFIRRFTPRSFGWLAGYLTGDGAAPNGLPVGTGIAFPANPREGDYFLRLDYLPQKLFRFNGKMWVEISRNVRTPPTLGIDDQSQISGFINNTAVVQNAQGGVVPSRQSLSNALKIQPD